GEVEFVTHAGPPELVGLGYGAASQASRTGAASLGEQDRHPPVARVLRVVGDQRLAVRDAFDAAEAALAYPLAQQRLTGRFGTSGRERPVVGAHPRLPRQRVGVAADRDQPGLRRNGV